MYSCDKLARGPKFQGGIIKTGRPSSPVPLPSNPMSDRRLHYFASPQNYVADRDGKDIGRPVGKLYISDK